MLSVSGLISTNTGTPPRSTIAFAVETKVKDGSLHATERFGDIVRAHLAAGSLEGVSGW
jgi:hypothetical protein